MHVADYASLNDTISHTVGHLEFILAVHTHNQPLGTKYDLPVTSNVQGHRSNLLRFKFGNASLD